MRVSFLGGGTDFEGFFSNEAGAVLSAAIDKYVFVIVKERFDGLIYVNYSKKETVSRVDDIEHDLVREALKMTGVDEGIEITTLADIPSEGTGLGSSSSITIGLLQALYAYQGESRTARELAEDACRIEIDILGRPMGKQDQYIAAYGNLRFITFNHNDIKVEKIPLNIEYRRKLSEGIMLFYTGQTRQSSIVLEEQKANIGERMDELREMRRLAFEGRGALLEGKFEEFGQILHNSWEIKKQLASKVSNPGIEDMYETARKAGALGGKISGAGGGGFLLLYCPNGRKDDVREALNYFRPLPVGIEPDGSKVIFNYRR
ncbi:MAG: GHMP kinase [Chloroflexota bacterium]|nr:GHMP kinase [Chloroflexota bacterium]